MKCRRLVYDERTKKQNIVWFGSVGKVHFNSTEEMPTEKYYALKIEDASELEDAVIYNYKMNGMSIKRVYIQDGKVYCYTKGRLLEPTTTILLETGTTFKVYYGKDTRMNIYIFNDDFLSWICNAQLVGENYAGEQEGVAASLIQRLSVIKGELWYKASYGLPLMEKIKNKGIYDSIIINIITSHPDVANITYYNSVINGTKYELDFIVYTIYNEEVQIKYTI